VTNNEIEQLGASIAVPVLERLKTFLGRKLIKNTVVEDAIVEYLDVRERTEPHVLRVEIDAELRQQIGRFHRENVEAPPDAIARHALRLLLDLNPSSREFVVRLHDERTIDLLERYCSAARKRPAVVAREAIEIFIDRAPRQPRRTVPRTPKARGGRA
jgi:hypothetical protein